MSVEYETPIDTNQDIVDKGQDLHFVAGTPFMNMYAQSKSEIKNQLAKKAMEDPSLVVNYASNGIITLELQQKLINEGMQKCNTDVLRLNLPTKFVFNQYSKGSF